MPFTFPPRMVAATRGVSGTLRKKQEQGQGSCALTLPRPRHLRARAPLAHRSSRQSDEDVARPGPKSRRSDLRLAACPTPGDDLGDQRRHGGATLAAGRLRAGAGSADLLKRDILNMIVNNVHREEDTAGDEAAEALWRGRVCKRQRRGGEGQGPRLLPPPAGRRCPAPHGTRQARGDANVLRRGPRHWTRVATALPGGTRQMCSLLRTHGAWQFGLTRGRLRRAPQPTPLPDLRCVLVLRCRFRGSGNPAFYSVSCIFEELLLQSCLWSPFCYFSWGTGSLQKLAGGRDKR